MRWLHLAVGIIGVIGFLATGQYMDLVHDHLRDMDDTRRLLFRSTHIYLLFASLVNLALGLYLQPLGTAPARSGVAEHWPRQAASTNRRLASVVVLAWFGVGVEYAVFRRRRFLHRTVVDESGTAIHSIDNLPLLRRNAASSDMLDAAS